MISEKIVFFRCLVTFWKCSERDLKKKKKHQPATTSSTHNNPLPTTKIFQADHNKKPIATTASIRYPEQKTQKKKKNLWTTATHQNNHPITHKSQHSPQQNPTSLGSKNPQISITTTTKTHITSVQKPTNCNNHNNKTNKSQQPSQQKPASPVFKNPQATNNPTHHNWQPTESTDLRRLCTRKTKGGWGFSVRDKRKRMGVCRARSKKGVGFCHVTKGKGKGGFACERE